MIDTDGLDEVEPEQLHLAGCDDDGHGALDGCRRTVYAHDAQAAWTLHARPGRPVTITFTGPEVGALTAAQLCAVYLARALADLVVAAWEAERAGLAST